jgi:hypothetical protein
MPNTLTYIHTYIDYKYTYITPTLIICTYSSKNISWYTYIDFSLKEKKNETKAMNTAVDCTGKGKISNQGTRRNQKSGCRSPKGHYDMRHTIPQEPIQKVRDESNIRN